MCFFCNFGAITNFDMQNKHKYSISLLLFFVFTNYFALAQKTFPQNGVYDDKNTYYAFVNATLVKDYQTTMPNATLLIKNDEVVQTGTLVAIPDGVTVIDLKGKYIYPSFVDLYSDYGIAKAERKPGNAPEARLSPKKGAYAWNEAIHPEVAASNLFVANPERAKMLREAGFGVVLTHAQNGIARGSGAVVTLADDKENNLVLKGAASNHFSFNKGTSAQGYPSSLMGAIALIRQSYYDADWYEKSKASSEYNLSLEAWNANKKLPQIFETNDKLDVLRVDKIAKEFDVSYIIKTNGTDYQRIDEIKATKSVLILPLVFGDVYDVEDVYDAAQISLSQLKHWEMAPANPAIVAQNQIEFALTASGLDPTKFWANLRKAIKYGLTEEQALKALTATPAKILGLEKAIGSLEKGKKANFFIASKPIFEDEAVVYQHWIGGEMYLQNNYPLIKDLRGVYDFVVGESKYELKIKGENAETLKFSLLKDTNSIDVKHKISGNFINLSFVLEPKQNPNLTRLSGVINGTGFGGEAVLADATSATWYANLKTASSAPNELNVDKIDEKKPKIGAVIYPFMAYGNAKIPLERSSVLIKNATVWTCENEGILERTDVFIDNGKIAQIGKDLRVNAAQTIDATGKHLTPGIIDEHSHIAITGGVNEGTQEVTAEVRIGDILDSEDIDIYRQLAGGVTTSHILHGSANPIGGQTALIKLRWGAAPDALKFEGADGFIKFALGENVKQSNWGESNNSRYPQTRMGVEQVVLDGFRRTKTYTAAKNNAKRGEILPRKDLELDALQEILDKKRFITCHSYVQSEINMLMHVADSVGFRVNTFTHILEGYKLADKMRAHGANASTFADWWAYKYEVIDAIPYNAAIMQEQGVNVCLNSDDAEMGRRLNHEAAKTIKYGNVSAVNALKMITINPAKTLHIDNKVGSIKVGKDADLVLWSDNPLSVYARAEKTFVDGICYFDQENDLKKSKENQLERERIIQKMLDNKQKGGKTQPINAPKKQHYHCDTILESYE